MNVLIIACHLEVGQIWGRHLTRRGAHVTLAHSQEEAIEALRTQSIDVIVVDIVLTDGSAIAIADFANYRQPDAKVIFVSNSSFFSDGSIFEHIGNAAAVIPPNVSADDLEAVVDYHAA